MRWIGFGFVLVMLLLAAWTIPAFEIEGDLAKLLPKDDPYFGKLAQIEKGVAGSRTLLLFLRGSEELEQIAADLRSSPYVEKVDATRDSVLEGGLSAARSAPTWFLRKETLEALADRMAGPGRKQALADLESKLSADPFAGRELAARDPLGLRWILEAASEAALPIPLAKGTPFLVLADGSRSLMRIVGKREPYDTDFSKAIVADLEARLRGRDHDILGGYSIAVSQERMIRSDLIWNSTLSIMLVLVYLTWSTRSFTEPLVLFFPSALAIFCAMPIGSYLFGPLSPLAISAAAILSGLGDDCPIHWLVRYDEERGRGSHAEAVAATKRAVLRPMLGAILTTMAAFLSLGFGQFRGLSGFGLLLALGLALSFAFTFVLMPYLTRLRRVRAPTRMRRMGGSRPMAYLMIGLAIAGAGTIALRGLVFTADPKAMRPADDPSFRIQAEAERELGFSPFPIIAVADTTLAPEAVATGASRLVANGTVRFFDGGPGESVTKERRSLVDEFQRRTSGWLESTLTELAELGYSAEAFRAGLEGFDELFRADAPVPGPHRDLRLFVNKAPKEPQEYAVFEREVKSQLGTNAQIFSSFGSTERLRRLLQADLLQAVALAAIAIVILTILLAGSLRAGLAALVTLAFAFSITLGIVSVFDIPLQIGNFVALPFVLGIGIDYGIFVVERMRLSEDLGETKVALIRKSLTTILGFGTLMTAKTPGLASMGLIAVLGITTCLLSSIFVLPRLQGFVAARTRTSES